jgi:hypothetical protein
MSKVLTAALALTLAGCAGSDHVYWLSHQILWVKPGITRQQLDADWSDCQAGHSSTVFNEKEAKQCMADRGYSWNDSGV